MSLSHRDCEWAQCSPGAVKHWHQADSRTVETNVGTLVGGEREVQHACEITGESRQGGFVPHWTGSSLLSNKTRSCQHFCLTSVLVGSRWAAPTQNPRGCSARTHYNLGSLWWFFSGQVSNLCFKRKKEKKRKEVVLVMCDAKTHWGTWGFKNNILFVQFC